MERENPEYFGQHVIDEHHPLIGRITFQWSRDLERLRREAIGREFALRTIDGQIRLDALSARLAATPVALHMRKRRQTAEMNSRYVSKNGKRVYVGKRKAQAEKRRRAEAERARREKMRIKLMHQPAP